MSASSAMTTRASFHLSSFFLSRRDTHTKQKKTLVLDILHQHHTTVPWSCILEFSYLCRSWRQYPWMPSPGGRQSLSRDPMSSCSRVSFVDPFSFQPQGNILRYLTFWPLQPPPTQMGIHTQLTVLRRFSTRTFTPAWGTLRSSIRAPMRRRSAKVPNCVIIRHPSARRRRYPGVKFWPMASPGACTSRSTMG